MNKTLSVKKLSLKRETVQGLLDQEQLKQAAGGGTNQTTTVKPYICQD